jgi:Trk-type K+ transport system membrane component
MHYVGMTKTALLLAAILVTPLSANAAPAAQADVSAAFGNVGVS